MSAALAVRRGVRAAMPFVVAWEDALAAMSREQLSTLTSIDVLGLDVEADPRPRCATWGSGAPGTSRCKLWLLRTPIS